MRIVIQRVKSASVTVQEKVVLSIGLGILSLVSIYENDTDEDMISCCKQILGAKIFENDDKKCWRHSAKQKSYSVLCVSQFTLYGTLTKGKPDYRRAMKSEPAQQLYNKFVTNLKNDYEPEKIHDGIFGAIMDISLVNDGPVTIIIESEDSSTSRNS